MMALAALCFVWAGMVLGISFLETPVKFTAPSVTLPIGLDVGRHVFGALNKVEILFVLIMAAVLCYVRSYVRPPRALWFPLAIVAVIVALQTAWLRPVLDARVELILSGQMPPPAAYHTVFSLLELLKLIGLIAAGIASLRAVQRSVPPAPAIP
jgi:hypothetical protein